MKRTARVTVGIDVTETQVNMVMLRRTSADCVVLDSATAPVPEHAIEGGRITDPRQLAKALKALRRRGRAIAGPISISLPAKGTLTRIIPLAEEDPQRIGQFVSDELKQYAILSGRETASDFRVLTVARPDARGTVLVAATDRDNVAALATAGRLAGLRIAAIEPAAIACTRLLCTDRTSGSADGGLMVVLLKESTLTLCVFRRGLLDFMRTEILEPDAEGSNEFGRRIAQEITKVLRFYSLRSDGMKVWKVVLADDERSSVLSGVLTMLGADTGIGSVSLVTPENPPREWMIDLRGRTGISLTALGLALRAVAAGEDGSSVNLLPPEVSAARSAKRNMFVMANALAILMLTIVVGTGAIAYMGKRINQNIVTMRQRALKRGEYSLPVTMDEMAYIDHRVQRLSAEVQSFKAIGSSRPTVDWVRFLDDVKNAVPARRVQLTELTSDGGAVATIRGVAVSAEAVGAFADALNTSTQIGHASVVRKDRNKRDAGHIEYEIQCSLSARKAP